MRREGEARERDRGRQKRGGGKEESDLKGKTSAVSSPSCAIRRNICIEERMELSAIGRKEEREERGGDGRKRHLSHEG